MKIGSGNSADNLTCNHLTRNRRSSSPGTM
jgi:hypothetical protein